MESSQLQPDIPSALGRKVQFLLLTFTVSSVAVLAMAIAGGGSPPGVSDHEARKPVVSHPSEQRQVVPAERKEKRDLNLPRPSESPQTSLYLPNIADIAERANGAVVNIRATEIIHGRRQRRAPDGPFEFFFPRPDRDRNDDDQRQDSGGTGFIVTPDGHIMTNYHVIKDADRIIVRLPEDSSEYRATVVGTDQLTDLALLKIDVGHDLPTIPLGDSDRLRVGEWVIAIGNPLVYDHTVTVGVVSAKGRKLVGLSRDVSLDNYIQTDAAINRGNSGGPLLNVRGEAVGINSAISVAGQGISFAIPINMARDVMVQLRETGKVSRGFLGVTIQDIQTEMRAEDREYFRLEGRQGAFIQSVTPGQPAAAAGLQRGDAIVRVDDEEITGSDDLIRTISSKSPGAKVRLGIVRDGKERDVAAKLINRPNPLARDARRGQPQDQEEPLSDKRLGMTVEDLTPQARRELNVDPNLKGVVVTHVSQVSTAWERGLRRGDIITEVNRVRISSLEEYRDIVDGLKPGEILALYVRTPGLTAGRFLTLRIGDE
ncbi:MAG: Do family serine endopeptidase [Acidobacteriota bacterium]